MRLPFARQSPRLVALVLAAVLPAQVGLLIARSGTPDARRAAPRTSTTTSPRTSPAEPAVGVFGGLGAWVDVYDYASLHPAKAIRAMKSHGVRTVYVQTGRFTDPVAIHPSVGAWISAAHAAGLKAVGWYLPGYRVGRRDVGRTVAAARFSFRGERFDGIAIDIEFKSRRQRASTWSARVAAHARAVRRALGDGYPIAAITLPPLDMAVAPSRWRGFPWRALGASSDAIILMNYWSNRDCPDNPDHCAYVYTVKNVRRVRALTGRPDLPIHLAGGVADAVSARDVGEFARAARAVRAHGVSLYDFRTTSGALWTRIRDLSQ